MNKKTTLRKTRIVKLDEGNTIVYIKHLGEQPYNEIKYECGKKIIVSYSLTYWHSIFQNFHRINKSVLINPEKIVSDEGFNEVVLIDNTRFLYSRRRLNTTNLLFKN